MGPTYLLGERQKNWGMKENVFMGREEFVVGKKKWEREGKQNWGRHRKSECSTAQLSSAQEPGYGITKQSLI